MSNETEKERIDRELIELLNAEGCNVLREARSLLLRHRTTLSCVL